MSNPDTQELVVRLGALEHALALSLRRLVEVSGPSARAEIEALRDRAIMNVKNSSISPERELEHAKLVRPAIEVLEAAFEHALRKLSK